VLGVGTLNNYVAVLFYAGYVYVFLEFCKVFESGGIGKNGSTIAVSLSQKCCSYRTTYSPFAIFCIEILFISSTSLSLAVFY